LLLRLCEVVGRSSFSSAFLLKVTMSLVDLHEERVRPLLDSVDRLRDILQGQEPIKLPSIVVVGDQSSGKSSVLESLSGIVLPRGQNIVTRCPLVLRMVCTPSNESESAEICTEGQLPESIEFDDIEAKIRELTDKLAGDRQRIVPTPINLTVRKQNCPDLTLIDLPGITRNPVGNQPKDIYNQIVTLIKKYIEPVESVILCVIPANIDFTTSEAIMLSREVDPAGVRTVGVVTKIDKCELGIRSKLECRTEADLKLALGYVAVRNRTQDEIDTRLSFEEARKLEKDYFDSHPELGDMPPHYKGTLKLATKLTEIQIERIRSILPKVRETIRERLRLQRTELSSLPLELISPGDCSYRFTELLQAFVKNLSQLIVGEYDRYMDDNEMHIPARLLEIFLKFEAKMRTKSPYFISREYQEIVINAMKETQGAALPNFMSPKLHSNLMAVELNALYTPAEQVLSESRACYNHVIELLCEHYFGITPTLCDAVKESIGALLDKREAEAKVDILKSIKRESIADPYTLNHYYMDVIGKIKLRVEKLKHAAATPGTYVSEVNDFTVNLQSLCGSGNEQQSAVDMQISVFAYWKVVHKRLSDTIALVTRQFFNAFLMNDLASELQKEYMEPDRLLVLMKDSSAVIRRRQELQASVKRLEKALDVFTKL